MNKKKMTIGLFGFGVVGEGIYNVLQQTPSLNAAVAKVCIRQHDKFRAAPSELFTTDPLFLLDDPGINVIVELIDNADDAFAIVSAALQKRKVVVSANKKMIAEHLPELLQLQNDHGTALLYEAAVCGSIPVIRNLEEYYDNDLLQSVCGIVNGSTNYILTKIITDGCSYPEALAEAQALGFAESNPALDVEGVDAANKLSLLLLHAYGIISHPATILQLGITHIDDSDPVYAEEKSYQIKLIAQARRLQNGKVAAFVLPQFVTAKSQLYFVSNEYNGVIIESKLADKQFLYGKGAGRYPTSSAVISDISALRYGYRYEYKKLTSGAAYEITQDYYLRIYLSCNSAEEINKHDFQWIDEWHSTQHRQVIIGLIHASVLMEAKWFQDVSVSVIVMPDGIVEREVLSVKQIRKNSLHMGGVH
ncbi:MAG: homoserine dehydrogenase [Chitinophagaceae bacterium]